MLKNTLNQSAAKNMQTYYGVDVPGVAAYIAEHIAPRWVSNQPIGLTWFGTVDYTSQPYAESCRALDWNPSLQAYIIECTVGSFITVIGEHYHAIPPPGFLSDPTPALDIKAMVENYAASIAGFHAEGSLTLRYYLTGKVELVG